MPYTTIKKPSDYFDGKTYLGSASAVTVTGLDFQPDLVWVKDRDNGNNHCLVDAVRGTGKYMSSDLNSVEINNATNSISAFNSDGFTTGTANPANEAASTTKGFMSWNWLASNTTASNTDGSITSTVSTNTTSSFSIVSYTGNGTAGTTVGHGLGTTPSVIIIKSRDGVLDWGIYHKSIGNTGAIYLDLTNATDTSAGFWNNTSPNSSVFTLGSGGTTNSTGDNYIAYCFADVQGFSKFGSYTGNGNADGPFIYTGFSPAMIIFKRTGIQNWKILDNKRTTYNAITATLNPNENAIEDDNAAYATDFLSNGFKIRNSNANLNSSGSTYIYMAFAAEPLVGDNPATAR